ncbi:NIPSNAP family protein [Hydrogenophaga sp. BPS33]|uniref:NIPSNAP family protein n=1 Tax=Hydrogenophaga sp. BPS33 TaxID=2651974 RepID=UPI00131FED94|nr:NIPSNAP family protein [Hydrogenophaga sp. BPS33]QHE88978.1 NIPSNAP family protein [Hydrogenophaga sp. BPS33]
MIVESRTYVLHPGQVARFMQLMAESGIEIEKRHLGGLLGFYSTEFGSINKVMHLWAFESHDERTRRRRNLYADPQWQAFVPTVLPLIRDMHNEILVPAPFSPPIALAADNASDGMGPTSTDVRT